MAGESGESMSSPETGADAARPKSRGKAQDEKHMSQALRSAYQRTVDEDIPPEMLDLLSKLD